MEQQPDRLHALAARCQQKLRADPNHPRATQLERDLARYEEAQRLGHEIQRK